MDSRRRATGNDVDLTNIVSGPRAKRARVTYNEEEQDVEMADAAESQPSLVVKQGMRLWNAVKQYKDPATGRELSFDFMKLVPKKLYPDYYKVISRPMALENVRSRLELNGYPTVESVMADLELIFENAKAYNVEGSGIYNDAADLQAVLLQEYRELTGSAVQLNEKQAELEKLLADTTNELCEATDENGFNLAYHFMELPDGTLYPQYYVVIRKPMCFNHILRKIPRHEYTTATSWGQDVELIFQNAYTFNEDGSPIVTQAKALQLLFNALTEKFPSEFFVEKSEPKPPVPPQPIKLKVGRPKKNSLERAPSAPAAKQRPSSSSVRATATPEATVKAEENVKVSTPPPMKNVGSPAPSTLSNAVKQQPAQTPAPQMPPPQQTPIRTNVPSAPVISRPPPPPSQARPYGYSPLISQPQIPPGPSFQASFVLGTPTPLPEGMLRNPITLVALRTLPVGRVIWLDAKEGVTLWSIRLAGGKRETSLNIDRVDIEDEDGVDEDDYRDEEEPRPKRRGRPPTRGLAAQAAMMNGNGHVKRVAAIEYLRGLVVKLNGRPLLPVEDPEGDPIARRWSVDLSPGLSVLDIGAWRIFVDRD